MRLSFPASVRLKRAGEFQALKRTGTSLHGKFMVLSVLKTADERPTRVGLITSRRVGGAVDRNRLRRRFREMVRVEWPQFKPGCWFVLIGRQRATSASFEELQREWRSLAARAGLLPRSS